MNGRGTPTERLASARKACQTALDRADVAFRVDDSAHRSEPEAFHHLPHPRRLRAAELEQQPTTGPEPAHAALDDAAKEFRAVGSAVERRRRLVRQDVTR